MTPQGQAQAPQQQSWFQSNWKWLAAVGCLVPLLCCGVFSVFAYLTDQGTPAARVDCGTPGPDGVDCDLKRTGGTAGLKACWNLEITCANGAVMTGKACGSLAGTEAAGKVNMPVAAFSNQEACDAPKSGAVKDLTVEAQ